MILTGGCRKEGDEPDPSVKDAIFNPNLTYGIVKDMEGNTYKTIIIGSKKGETDIPDTKADIAGQTWMAENLRTTTYNDGTAIPHVPDMEDWAVLATPGYCYFYNKPYYIDVMGLLYNWHAVNTNKLCPTGWHVPTFAEWEAFTLYLMETPNNIGSNVENKIAKSLATGCTDTAFFWLSESELGTPGNHHEDYLVYENRTGFSALPAGCRPHPSGTYWNIRDWGFWWSSTPYYSTDAYGVYIKSNDPAFRGTRSPKGFAFSVRCIKDY
jgi:uncharacterized protein (TIGR02145 family)